MPAWGRRARAVFGVLASAWAVIQVLGLAYRYVLELPPASGTAASVLSTVGLLHLAALGLTGAGWLAAEVVAGFRERD